MSSSGPLRPNVLLILADDLGFSDIGCYGSEIATPNLDRLAANGMRFSQMLNCARCCPTRASLLTGLYPHQAGVGLMVKDQELPAYRGFLGPHCVTLAEALGDAGYRCASAGKWHIGGEFARNDPTDWTAPDPVRPLPVDRGFVEWTGTPAGAGSYFTPKPMFDGHRVIEPADDSFYYTDFVTETAVAQIGRALDAGQPFFEYIAYTAPHWPLHAREEDIARYRGRYAGGWDRLRDERHARLAALGLLDPLPKLSPRAPECPAWADAPNREWEAERMAVYAAQVDRMDQGIGKIVEFLRKRGAERNTLILFLSDNGGCRETIGPNVAAREWPRTRDGRAVRFGNDPAVMPGGADTYQSYGPAWANASNTPFRLFKCFAHEGGISTPLVAHWPDSIAPGSVCHRLSHVIDIAPTLLEAAGITPPTERSGNPRPPLAGNSFFAHLRGGPDTPREEPVFLEHIGNRMVRAEEWKLVSRQPGDHWELYRIREDRAELHDLADRYPDIVARLARQYDDWAAACGVRPWADISRRPARRR